MGSPGQETRPLVDESFQRLLRAFVTGLRIGEDGR